MLLPKLAKNGDLICKPCNFDNFSNSKAEQKKAKAL